MKAVQLVRWQAEPELREVEVPEPRPGEVLVKVVATGLCHSDLHVMEWPEGTLPWRLPFTLGHETAGVVAVLGSRTVGLTEGEPVLVYGPWGCGSCVHCAAGGENLCERRDELAGAGCGLGYDGGLAEYVLVPSPRLLVPIGELDPVGAAPLTDAALTSYSAVKRELPRLVPGSAVVVIGVGGLGHVAVQLLRELSAARIVAVDLRERSRQRALEAGADVALDGQGLSAADVREALGGRGATVVFDFVGTDETLALVAATIGMSGHVSLVGIGGGTLPMAFGTLPFEWSMSKPSWGSLPELHEVVALARAGAIRIDVERFGLDQAIDGYRRLRNGDVDGRAVVLP